MAYAQVSYGSTGSSVSALQEKLNANGYQLTVDGVFGTNLTYRTPELLKREWFHEVDCSKYVAYYIAALNHNISISALIDSHDKIQQLLEKKRG